MAQSDGPAAQTDFPLKLDFAPAPAAVTTLPQTGGVSTPWTGIIILNAAALLLLGGLGLAWSRRSR